MEVQKASLAMIAFGAFEFIVPKHYCHLGKWNLRSLNCYRLQGISHKISLLIFDKFTDEFLQERRENVPKENSNLYLIYLQEFALPRRGSLDFFIWRTPPPLCMTYTSHLHEIHLPSVWHIAIRVSDQVLLEHSQGLPIVVSFVKTLFLEVQIASANGISPDILMVRQWWIASVVCDYGAHRFLLMQSTILSFWMFRGTCSCGVSADCLSHRYWV